MTTIIAHKTQVVIVEPGTIIQDERGDRDIVTEDAGVQIKNTFFMTRTSWDNTFANDPSIKALVLMPAPQMSGKGNG